MNVLGAGGVEWSGMGWGMMEIVTSLGSDFLCEVSTGGVVQPRYGVCRGGAGRAC